MSFLDLQLLMFMIRVGFPRNCFRTPLQCAELVNLEREYRRHADEYDSCEKRLQELKHGVTEIMDRPREALEEELENFDVQMQERKEKVASR